LKIPKTALTVDRTLVGSPGFMDTRILAVQ
jgi:hypothetical protein